MHHGPLTAVLDHLHATVARGGGASDDAELLTRYVDGRDGEAFAAIVHRHGPLVWALCRDRLPSADAEDAFQATFLILARKAGGIAKRSSLASWLSGVARRVVRQAQRRRVTAELPPELVAADADTAERREERAAIAAAVDRLAEKYRLPVLLCYYQGLTNAEAAERLGWPVGTVAGRLARAREQLRRRLDGLASVPPTALIGVAYQPTSLGTRAAVVALMEATMKATLIGYVKLSVVAVGLLGLAGTGVGWGLRLATAQAPADPVVPPFNFTFTTPYNGPPSDPNEPEKGMKLPDANESATLFAAITVPSNLAKAEANEHPTTSFIKIRHLAAVREFKDRLDHIAQAAQGIMQAGVIASARRVLDSELALSEDPRKQKDAVNRYMRFTTYNMLLQRARHDAGGVPRFELEHARYCYLDAAVRLSQGNERLIKAR